MIILCSAFDDNCLFVDLFAESERKRVQESEEERETERNRGTAERVGKRERRESEEEREMQSPITNTNLFVSARINDLEYEA